ncbi:MAG: hypothetical protein J2P37_10220 [Ktedonobacteraceae bacterium]|nr:hypothetical protein [Ktedonobacteraceae bacterium]
MRIISGNAHRKNEHKKNPSSNKDESITRGTTFFEAEHASSHAVTVEPLLRVTVKVSGQLLADALRWVRRGTTCRLALSRLAAWPGLRLLILISALTMFFFSITVKDTRKSPLCQAYVSRRAGMKAKW